jgi:hypothetical protein
MVTPPQSDLRGHRAICRVTSDVQPAAQDAGISEKQPPHPHAAVPWRGCCVLCAPPAVPEPSCEAPSGCQRFLVGTFQTS